MALEALEKSQAIQTRLPAHLKNPPVGLGEVEEFGNKGVEE
jgi:hypothetical protein